MRCAGDPLLVVGRWTVRPQLDDGQESAAIHGPAAQVRVRHMRHIYILSQLSCTAPAAEEGAGQAPFCRGLVFPVTKGCRSPTDRHPVHRARSRGTRTAPEGTPDYPRMCALGARTHRADRTLEASSVEIGPHQAPGGVTYSHGCPPSRFSGPEGGGLGTYADIQGWQTISSGNGQGSARSAGGG